MTLKTLRQLRFRENFHNHGLCLLQPTSLTILLGKHPSFIGNYSNTLKYVSVFTTSYISPVDRTSFLKSSFPADTLLNCNSELVFNASKLKSFFIIEK